MKRVKDRFEFEEVFRRKMKKISKKLSEIYGEQNKIKVNFFFVTEESSKPATDSVLMKEDFVLNVDDYLFDLLYEKFKLEYSNALVIDSEDRLYQDLEKLVREEFRKFLDKNNGDIEFERDQRDFIIRSSIKVKSQSALNEGSYFFCREEIKKNMRIILYNYN